MRIVVRDRYGPPEVLRIEEVDIPEPGPGQALVKVAAASVNTADLDDLMGRPRAGRVGRGLLEPTSPTVGLDMAGTVEAVGSEVTTLQPGDDVWADMFSHGRGSFGEYVCSDAGAFHPKPPDLPFEVAATIPHSGLLALQGLRPRGPIRAGDKVLINGAGGCVGPFAIQIAKSMGAEVTGVDHGEKLELVRKAGADHLVDYRSVDVTRNGVRYDRILDIAATRSFLAFRRSLTRSGVYTLVARNIRGFFGAAVVGGLVSMVSSRRMGVFSWQPNDPDDLMALAQMVKGGAVSPIVERTFELGDTPRALRLVADGRARGKLVIIPG